MIARKYYLLFMIFLIALAARGADTAAAAGVIKPIDIVKAFSGSAPEINLEEMIQECPNFVSYPGYDGVVWLKQITYQIESSGSMSVTTAWVVLGRIGIEDRWLDWSIDIPKGGEAEVFEASLYDPGSLERISGAAAGREGDKWRVTFQNPPEEFITVLTYRQVYSGLTAIEGMVWLNETLPVWEQSVVVKVDSGRDFEYVTNTNIEPGIRLEGNADVYEWMVVNQTPATRRSLRTDSRAWLAFGSKQPLANFVKLLEGYANLPVPNPPSEAEAWIKKGDLAALFTWLRERETDVSVSVREAIPESGPWSEWEKSIIAASWINRANKDTCRLFWRLAVDPLANGFANATVILSPAIEMKRKKDIFFYDMQQPYEPGNTSLSLIGEALYAPVKGKNELEKRMIPPRGAADNRLSVVYDLDLSPDNTITGTVTLTLRNSWIDFLLTSVADAGAADAGAADAGAAKILSEITGEQAAGRDIEAKEVRGGLEIKAPVKSGTLIVGTAGGNAIIPLSSPQPDWLRELAAAMIPYSIKFPLTIETNYKLKLGPNVRDVIPPMPVERDNGNKISYSERYEYFKRSGRFETTVRLAISATQMDAGTQQDMAFALSRLAMPRSIPLKLR